MYITQIIKLLSFITSSTTQFTTIPVSQHDILFTKYKNISFLRKLPIAKAAYSHHKLYYLMIATCMSTFTAKFIPQSGFLTAEFPPDSALYNATCKCMFRASKHDVAKGNLLVNTQPYQGWQMKVVGEKQAELLSFPPLLS